MDGGLELGDFDREKGPAKERTEDLGKLFLNGVKVNLVSRNIERSEKWEPDEVIPVKVSHQDMEPALAVAARPFHEFGTEAANSGSRVDDDLGLGAIHFDTRSISAEPAELARRERREKRLNIGGLSEAPRYEELERFRDPSLDLGRQ